MNDQRIILLDGPDGCGKTNIAKALSDKMRIPYFRMATQHENWRKNQFKTALQFDQTYLTEILKQTRHSMVIDRAWPSEWVYSKVFGRTTDNELLEKLDVEWSKLGAWLVIPFRQSFDDAREDEIISKGQLLKIQAMYSDFIRWTRCNVINLYVDDLKCDINQELRVIMPELENWWRKTTTKVFCEVRK